MVKQTVGTESLTSDLYTVHGYDCPTCSLISSLNEKAIRPWKCTAVINGLCSKMVSIHCNQSCSTIAYFKEYFLFLVGSSVVHDVVLVLMHYCLFSGPGPANSYPRLHIAIMSDK